MPRVAKGYIEQLPSGSFRVSVYGGTDPLTRPAIRLKVTAKTEQQAHIELGRLLKDASEGRTPESDATMAKLLDESRRSRSGTFPHGRPTKDSSAAPSSPPSDTWKCGRSEGPSSTSCMRG
jgi:hypothetical protein